MQIPVNSLAEENKVYGCIADNVNGKKLTMRSSLANGSFFTPTIIINKYKAKMFFAAKGSGIVYDLTGEPNSILLYNDFSEDRTFTHLREKLKEMSEYDLYRESLQRDGKKVVSELIVPSENGLTVKNNSGSYKMMLLLSVNEKESAFFSYSCVDEEMAEEQGIYFKY